ncbi:MAG: GAF domain-containing protein [Anaerolineales bacterium]
MTANSKLFSITEWRERFLRSLKYPIVVFGLVALIASLFTTTNGLLVALYIVAYGALLAITFIRLPYNVRAGVFLFVLYAIGASGVFKEGLWGDARLFFLTFVCMSLLLFRLEVGYFAIALSLITVAVGGLLINSGAVQLSSAEVTVPGSLSAWVDMSVVLLVLAGILIYGLQLFQVEFAKAQESTISTLKTLEAEHVALEQRVEERTAGLTKKTEQFRAASAIARKTAELQDLASLLNTVARLVTDQFGFYHTGIFLINESGDHAVLQAASSEGGQRMIEKGHALSVGTQGIVGYVAAQKKPRIALDVGIDAVFFNNPDLPMTRSEVALPMLVRNKMLGVLDIQSDKPQAFNTDDIEVLQTLADQVAIAIENAHLLDETQAAIIQLEALTAVRTREAWSRKLRERSRVFTYTPLGLRAERLPQHEGEAVRIPILLRGQKIGNISIARKGDVTWSKLDENLIQDVANQVALAVDNIRLLEEATQHARQEQAVGKLANRFSQSLDLDTLLQSAARELGQLPDVSEVSVAIGRQTEQTSPPRKRSQRNQSQQ